LKPILCLVSAYSAPLFPSPTIKNFMKWELNSYIMFP
jgi:hypothetical protein